MMMYFVCWLMFVRTTLGELPEKSRLVAVNGQLCDNQNSTLRTTYYLPKPCHLDEVDTFNRIESVIHWVEGPFVNNVMYKHTSDACGSAHILRLPDSQKYTSLPEEIMSNPVKLRSYLERRHHLSVEFSLRENASEFIELRWVHFRGNTKLVPLGSGGGSGEELLIYPGTSVRQFTHGGHMFVAMNPAWIKRKLQVTNSGYQSQHPAFAQLEDQIERIVGIYMIPAIHQSCTDDIDCSLKIEIDVQRSVLFHAHKLLEGTRCNTAPPEDSNEYTVVVNASECFRELLMRYWEQQRLSQVYVNTWAVPSLPVAASLRSAANHPSYCMSESAQKMKVNEPVMVRNGAHSSPGSLLWTTFDVDPALATSLSDFHHALRQSSDAAPEPPISLVFNQFEVPTRYVPLPPHLLDAVVEEVRRAAAAWLDTRPEDLLLTGAYGSREYGHGAIVRWHVDPVDTQPITAIVHLAEQYLLELSTELSIGSFANAEPMTGSRSSWGIQVPKSPESYRNYTDYGTHTEENDALHNVHLRLGQVLLLQSAKLPHARVVPFPGEWYANAFVHFAPVGWAAREDVRILS